MNEQEKHTDIQMHSIVARFPKALRPYAYLARLDRPIGIWLLLLPGLWAILLASGGVFSMNGADMRLVFLFVLGAIVMRSAGCVINDLWDRKLDRQVARTQNRPLASGVLSPRQGLIFLAALLLVGLFILVQMDIVTILLGFLVFPLIVIYPVMKRFTWWPQAFLGITFNFGALMGWSAVTHIVEYPALCLYMAGILWTLGYDTIYAHQDMEDDLFAGIKSTALRFGAQSKKWVIGFYGASAVMLCAAFLFAGVGALSLVFVVPVVAHFSWQIKNWDALSPQSSLKIFKSNRNCGLLILAVISLL